MTQTISSTRHEQPLVSPTPLGSPRKNTRTVEIRAHWVGLAVFLTMLPVTMVVPVLKDILVDRFGATVFVSHAFMIVNMVGGILAAPFAAALSDRLTRRLPIILAALIFHAVTLFLMAEVTHRGGSLSLLFLLRFFEGAAHLTILTSLMALALDGSRASSRGRTMGMIGGLIMFGTAFGTPLGGRLGDLSPVSVFYAGSFISIVALLVVKLTTKETALPVRGPGLKEALGLVKQHRVLLVPYAFALVDRFCVGIIISSFIFYMRESLQFSPGRIGLYLALFLFPMAFLCYPIGRLSDRWGRAVPMAVGSIAFGLLLGAYGCLTPGWLALAMVMSGVASAIMFAPNLALASDLTPVERRAIGFAGFNVAGSIGFLAGPLFGGIVLSTLMPVFGSLTAFRLTFAMAGATEVACVLFTLPWLFDLHRQMNRDAAGGQVLSSASSRNGAFESAHVQ